ncbi:MAG: DUF4159 domain-containing protein [Bacteroidota bacterium]|uniref:DUF4159 domain-containing protein n=1 Tax=Nonlabens tegetincola TaxID=323273 RepID=UPI000A2047B5|nr:DUF4159 domain-containing protein [Nonlabens tegetincola]ARN70776.1 hypothetical protein BST91_03485 [Nonlabens tegetincola]MEE2801201.1 DUF4159 domain-containing protein [Bacteroidota bacterium]
MRKILILLLFLTVSVLNAQQLAVLKYNGGGDWYSNPTAVPNLITYCNENIGTTIDREVATVEPGSVDIFQFPYVHMTGHGNVIWNDDEVENLRNYLMSGGFLHIDDNYGMEQYLNKELIKLFPQQELIELPATHPIFNNYASFPSGLPKIHEHDGKRPQAKGLFYEGRLVLLFTVESDLGDGWESPEVHNDPPEVRKKALDMGANIIKYVFSN